MTFDLSWGSPPLYWEGLIQGRCCRHFQLISQRAECVMLIRRPSTYVMYSVIDSCLNWGRKLQLMSLWSLLLLMCLAPIFAGAAFLPLCRCLEKDFCLNYSHFNSKAASRGLIKAITCWSIADEDSVLFGKYLISLFWNSLGTWRKAWRSVSSSSNRWQYCLVVKRENLFPGRLCFNLVSTSLICWFFSIRAELTVWRGVECDVFNCLELGFWKTLLVWSFWSLLPLKSKPRRLPLNKMEVQ